MQGIVQKNKRKEIDQIMSYGSSAASKTTVFTLGEGTTTTSSSICGEISCAMLFLVKNEQKLNRKRVEGYQTSFFSKKNERF